ncbi:hypothetical protein ANCCEY_10881 [Ancylostoma ceylanicum]|uniref:Hexosyltransferase n=1 Tax=Ancylostoma ceylanicum TaxID=53326 RepID=A0A0D6LDL7_9BILA|nr:hypothetical protein ANCCEY_10881 [Ancylostoma ceylanicum]
MITIDMSIGLRIQSSRVSAPNFRYAGPVQAISELERLAEEQQVSSDLIVTDIIESYRNLLLKARLYLKPITSNSINVHVMLMFFQEHCPGVKYLIKVDDDVAVVMDRMLNRLDEDTDVFFTGIVAESAGVRRMNWSESMILTDQY